jgi:glycosyltransferase involved in cell wall biosynthesis
LITVVVPTRDPDYGRLLRTLEALARQTLESGKWELVIVDNGSSPPLPESLLLGIPAKARQVRETTPGLTHARLAGIHAAGGEVIVFVDDDNVLCPDYLAAVAAHFANHPKLGAAGGPVVPEWQVTPPAWTHEFHGLLALRDLGPEVQIARGGPGAPWPNHAPVGAGLAVRRSFALTYAAAVSSDPRRAKLDRQGSSLASGGDNDLVFTTLHAGGDVGYFPDLRLTHLIPAGRLEAAYLARLNRGIMRSWVVVLALHGQCPWRPIKRWSVPLRAARAWLRLRTWKGQERRARWAGVLGQFEGQADLSLTLGISANGTLRSRPQGQETVYNRDQT